MVSDLNVNIKNIYFGELLKIERLINEAILRFGSVSLSLLTNGYENMLEHSIPKKRDLS